MTNAFSGIITDVFKTTFKNAISSLIYGTRVPCSFIFGSTKFTNCTNCTYSAIGGRSTSRYITGGPMPFSLGQPCPMCNGAGKIPVENTSTISLVVLWDYRDWIGIGARSILSTHSPEGFVQTMSEMSTITSINQVKEVIMNTDIQGYTTHRFQRYGTPEPIGFGEDSFLLTMWKRIG